MSATGGDYADNLNILGRSLVYSSGSGRNCQAAGVILDRGCLVRSSYMTVRPNVYSGVRHLPG